MIIFIHDLYMSCIYIFCSAYIVRVSVCPFLYCYIEPLCHPQTAGFFSCIIIMISNVLQSITIQNSNKLL